MKCDACGRENVENAEFRSGCGKNIGSKYIPEEYLKEMKKERQKNNKVDTIILIVSFFHIFIFSPLLFVFVIWTL